jgi:hypothetical protein
VSAVVLAIEEVWGGSAALLVPREVCAIHGERCEFFEAELWCAFGYVNRGVCRKVEFLYTFACFELPRCYVSFWRRWRYRSDGRRHFDSDVQKGVIAR